MLASNTILQNRYRIVRQLGQGGMGTVYEAIDERVSCVVAIKETLATNDSEARRAFEREAALLANLRHPLLPKVMDHFIEDEGQFLVMEFIHGYDLAELLDVRGTPFAITQVLKWADELLKVLEYLHGRKPPILHRDLKPSNLKLTKEGEIFVLDFGLAKGAAGQMPTLMTSRSVRGYTPVYAPLEQIHGQGTDPRSDVYSLGATLYHLMTGTQPTDAPTRFTAVEDDRPDPLRPIDEVNPQVPHAIAAVIHQAMAVSRKHRHANAAAMRSALREAEEETRHQEEVRLPDKQAQEKHQAEQAARLHSDAEAARRATDDERVKQEEAETRRLQSEQDHRETEEETRRRAEETKASQNVIARTQRSKNADEPVTAPGMKTIKGEPAQIYQAADALNRSPAGTIDQVGKESGKPGNRTLMIAAAAVVGVVLIFALGWLLFRSNTPPDNGSQPVTDGQKTTNRPMTGNANQPLPPAGMAYVPGGTFTMGRNDGDDYERPAHSVTVKPLFIDIYEVTNEEYMKFVQATNHKAPSGWANIRYPAGATRKPVTGVTWDDVNAYAKWAGKRLPTEEEWEFAARGTDGRRYPWGNEWQAGLANAAGASSGMADVGTFKGASPFGAFDMAGNAWEWTSSRMIAYPGGTLPEKVSDDLKVIRGGLYSSDKNQATTTIRRGWRATAEDDYGNTGFRCVQDVGNTSK